MKDIKKIFIPYVSTQENNNEEKEDLFQSHLEKIEKQLESVKLESSKFDDSLQRHGSIQVQETNLSPRLTCEIFMARIQSHGFFRWSNSLIYTKFPLCKR